ncbi:MAG: branched-chain amino acid transporter AzlC [Elusimicrobia bacterium]|nr:MAG: branched-chain amino acid transporter AzlC [Elusimicrobiota bacterium]
MISHALKNTFPIVTAYIATGMGFGLLFATQLEYPWYWAVAMGVFVFAGAAQFLAVGLLASGARAVEIAIATWILNLRHFFYGLSMLQRFQGAGAFKPYLIFALTDETYGVLTSTEAPAGKKHSYFFAVSVINQCAWVLGCGLGAFAGSRLAIDTTGVEFILTALFSVMAYEQYKQVETVSPLLLAGCAWMLSVWVLGAGQALLPAILLMTCGLFMMRRGLEK